MTGFAAVLAHVRTVVAALTPVSRGEADSRAFTHTDGLLSLDSDAPVMDRLFEVVSEGAGVTLDHLAADARQVRKRLAIRIRYDSRHDLASLENRMAEDEEQIVDTLEARASYATGVDLVTYAEGSIARDNPAFPIVTLSFDVIYTRATF
jgi:hypothetical protein